jgi:hypothetical protein
MRTAFEHAGGEDERWVIRGLCRMELRELDSQEPAPWEANAPVPPLFS